MEKDKVKGIKYLISLVLLLGIGLLFATGAEASRKYRDLPVGTDYWTAKADSLTGFDVQKYTIDIAISQEPNHIEGKVLAEVVATLYLDEICYNLQGLEVDWVKVNGVLSPYEHLGGIISIPLNIPAGQSFTTEVSYGGTPQLSGAPYNVGMIFRSNSIFTISDPDAARYWWPCYDHPWDKAIVDIIVTMRSDWKVAANGLRESIVDNGNGTSTTTWRGEYPMTTYLACITAGDYVEIPQTALDGELPILNFVTPNQYQNALNDLNRLPEMIDYYSSLFGTYPFEKYGNATVNMSTFGAMEHQTMTTLGNYIIDGIGGHELTIAHELVHQWFGNAVSFLDFKDVWLSEGFATYGEMLWIDHTEGWQAACDYVLGNYHQYYTNWESAANPPAIYDPPFNRYFYPQSYQKAASVLHMLRLKMGDEMFFQFINEYFETFKHGNAITAEFQALAEDFYGESLEQFFQQWIFGRGIPSVSYSLWHHPANNQLKIIAKTTCTGTDTLFEVDVPFLVHTAAGSDSLLAIAAPEGYHNVYDGIGESLSHSANHNNWTILRGLAEERMQITSVVPCHGSVTVNWQHVPGVAGYVVFYQADGDEDWQNYVTYGESWAMQVVGLENGVLHRFKVALIDNEGFFGMTSEVMEATPVAFSFSQDLLLVDETRDGNGSLLNPTDEQVDDFYNYILSSYEYEQWDVVEQGLPPLDVLADYKIVIWHDDDLTQALSPSIEQSLGAYCLGGGVLVFSGYGTATAFGELFWQLCGCPDIEVFFDNNPCLIGVESSLYPPLELDQYKIPANWDGALGRITTFEGVSHPMYTAVMNPGTGENGANKAVAFKANRLHYFGFPLYYMQAEGVKELIEEILEEVFTSVEDEHSPLAQVELKVYPNPFNPNTNISLTLPKAVKDGEIAIYNLKGQKLKSIGTGSYSKGLHHLTVDMGEYSSGIYLVSFSSKSYNITKKLSLIK